MAELDRRDFLKLVGAGAGTAGAIATGCERPEKLIPYVIQPESVTPGLPVYYASTCRECPAGCGLHVKTREGRPIKLDGNPEHPVNRGALCARGQAALARPFHPDRVPGPLARGADGSLSPVSWEQAMDLLVEKVSQAGAGTFVLGDDPGPTLSSVVEGFVRAAGAGGRVVYEPFAPESQREAARLVYGVDAEPLYDLSQTDLVIAFGADVLATWLSPTEHMRQLAQARDVADANGRRARFVSVSPRQSLTTGNADEWIAARPGSEGILALGLARVALAAGAGTAEDRALLDGLLADFGADEVARRCDVAPDAIRRLGRALAAARAPVALPPGVELASRRAAATAAAVLVLNHVIGAVGSAVSLAPEEPARDGRRASYKDVLALIDSMNSGAVSVLLVHGVNPVYSLPRASGFADALEKVPFVVSFAPLADETAARADLILPDDTPLESWGDASPRRGVRSLLQPTLRRLADSRSLGDTLLDASRRLAGDAAAVPDGSFRDLLEAAWSGTDFRAALARGGVFEPAAPPPAPALAASVARLGVSEAPLDDGGEHVLLAYPHPFLYDGRGASLPHLQEIPDPVTKVSWQSWAEMSHATADRLGVGRGDLIEVGTKFGKLSVPAFPRGGIRDDVIAIPVGQGHRVGHYASMAGDRRAGGPADVGELLEAAEPRGVNVIEVLPAVTDESGGRAWLAARATLRRTGGYRELPRGQTSDNKRGRLLGEAVDLAVLAAPGESGVEQPGVVGDGHGAAGDDHGDGGHAEGGGHHEFLIPFDPVDDSHEDSPYRWGMNVDLERCTGCSACVAACYTENNIPLVGEREFALGRGMSWLRIERYVGEGDGTHQELGRSWERDREELGRVDVRHSPQLCQHCGSAPCEPVCPVYATYHNPEGLNGMIYNRCIGTRYCSNNCPYKVRRFNFWDYALRNWPGRLGLMLNPDVTVRAKGVMEKCTYCVQRIEFARQAARDEDRPIRDGEVRTACQEACPTQAILFGNLKDEESAVVKQRAARGERSYIALHDLNTRPGTTYFAEVTRGPVEG